MYYIGDYGIKHYYADTYNDIVEIPIKDTAPGSTVFVIDTSTYYMLNNQKKWISVQLSTGGGGGGTPGGEIIYEGGGV